MKIFLAISSFYFLRDMFAYMPIWVRIWVMALMTAMIVAPLFFLEHAAARWMLGATLAGGMTLGWMHMKMGITKAMGLAHIYWFAPMVMIFLDLWSGAYTGPYQAWLVTALTLGSLSLVLDVYDVISYLRGNRKQIAPPAP